MYQQLRWVHVAMPLVDHYHQSNNQKPPPRPATATMRFAITHHTNRSIPLATRAAIASLFSRKSSNPLWLTMTSMKVLQSPHRQWWEVLIAVADCNCGYYDFSSLICFQTHDGWRWHRWRSCKVLTVNDGRSLLPLLIVIAVIMISVV